MNLIREAEQEAAKAVVVEALDRANAAGSWTRQNSLGSVGKLYAIEFQCSESTTKNT